MKVACDLVGEGKVLRGELSDEHSASSYGLPVLLVKGEPVKPAELELLVGANPKVLPAARDVLLRTRGPVADAGIRRV